MSLVYEHYQLHPSLHLYALLLIAPQCCLIYTAPLIIAYPCITDALNTSSTIPFKEPRPRILQSTPPSVVFTSPPPPAPFSFAQRKATTRHVPGTVAHCMIWYKIARKHITQIHCTISNRAVLYCIQHVPYFYCKTMCIIILLY